ncbi:carboxypeptidase-like regulatory domain-containing protein [Flavobacterium sp. RHBU_3]|uniref:carboxypeptidase-like regulatory domain-containing protein n=1 Tax=Flavobacterium sp. RHBU_3 TaxID=3391184 RepID=UPI0039854068
MKKCLTVLLFVAGLMLNAQQATGVIKDAETNETIPFVNIGVVGKGVGTVCGEDGAFSIKLPAGMDNDTLRISSIGYAAKNFLVKDFFKALESNKTILLSTEAIKLDEVVISNKKPKEKTLGSTTTSKSMILGFTTDQLGNELGVLMRIKGSQAKLLKFTAQVASNDNPPVTLRLNFYTVKNGLPDKPIATENIFVTLPKEAGPLVVDLTKYNIMVEDDFVVALEWLEDNPAKIRFSAALLGPYVVVRNTSQGEWAKEGAVTVGFTVDTLYWK